MSSAAVGFAVARAVTICYFNYRKFRIWSESLVDASFLPSFLPSMTTSIARQSEEETNVNINDCTVGGRGSVTHTFIHHLI